MGVSKNNGTPTWMVNIMENPIFLMDDLGVPLFLETSSRVNRFSLDKLGFVDGIWGDETLPSYVGSIVNHYKDSFLSIVLQPSIFWCFGC